MCDADRFIPDSCIALLQLHADEQGNKTLGCARRISGANPIRNPVSSSFSQWLRGHSSGPLSRLVDVQILLTPGVGTTIAWRVPLMRRSSDYPLRFMAGQAGPLDCFGE